MTLQLLREWPPGFGGVERVAHELAVYWQTQGCPNTVFSFGGAHIDRLPGDDPLPVPYGRVLLPRLRLGRLLLPMPSRPLWHLLRSPEPLHAHLPCPGVLLVLVLACVLQPRRQLSVHWHAFLDGGLHRAYQQLALAVVRWLPLVVTTSPPLAAGLVRRGCRPSRVRVLPCCLDAAGETAALALPERPHAASLRVLFIGRLDSYKRVDWLIQALAALPQPWQLDVVGTGPRRAAFEALAHNLPVRFWGRLEEQAKHERLAQATLLVLPSDRCNEAFGIVQLEAMASGLPSLAFDLPDSGMAWVGRLPRLQWSMAPVDLADVLARLAADPVALAVLGRQARQRYQRLFARSVWLRRLDRLAWH